MREPNLTDKPLVCVVVGPTAAGKTAAAIELAREGNGAVISADSRQLYAGMNVGTAKPEEAWRAEAHGILEPEPIEGVDHYLFNTEEPDEPVTLAEWQEAGVAVIEHLLGHGKTPVIAGGTMLYVDSIVRNFLLPQVEPNPTLRQELESLSIEELSKRLRQEDPGALEFIEPQQKRRMVRALEVVEATGQPFSAQRREQPAPYRFAIRGLFPGWEVLEERITNRIEEMITQGLLEETRSLQARYGADLPLLKTLNYKQAGLALAGALSIDEAKKEMIKENVRYAKRQMKWWRNRYEEGEIEWRS